MSKTYSNPCIRCGKERVVVKIWEEKIYDSVIVNTKTSCPDASCQKKVDGENKKQHDKNTAMKARSAQRAVARKAVSDAKKSTKHV